nr:SyfB [Erythrocladia irregularis]
MNPESVCEQLTLAGCEVEEIVYCKVLDKEDCVVDITSTPNRADLLSMIGLANEIATILNRTNKSINNIKEDIYTNKNNLDIATDHDLFQGSSINLPGYLTCISHINKIDTPDFIKRALITSGLVVKNTVSDIGNYIMLKWGYPLEIIDCSNHNPINRRNLSIIQKKEQLEDKNRSITTLITQLYDKPTSLIGIKIQPNFEISTTTNAICIQGIVVPVSSIRNNSKYANLRTESSIRHERGLNLETLELAFFDAILLIKKVYPQAILDKIYNNIIKQEASTSHSIELNLHKVRKILGPIKLNNAKNEEISVTSIHNILRSLNCNVKIKNNLLKVAIPNNRFNDLTRDIDLIEEIARIKGLNCFAEHLPKFSKYNRKSQRQIFVQEFKKKLRFFGFTETVHYSLVSGKNKNIEQIKNPLTSEYNSLRNTLLFNLLDSFNYNFKQNNEKITAFEIGRVFLKSITYNKIEEKEMVAGIFGSNLNRVDWQSPSRHMDWFEAKGILELLLKNLQNKISWQSDIQEKYSTIFHPKRSASINLKGKPIGIFGQIHPQILDNNNFPDLIYGFEIDMESLMQPIKIDTNKKMLFKEYSSFPMIIRDTAIEVSLDTSVQSIIDIINSHKPKILTKVELLNEYQGIKIAIDKRSLTFRFYYKSATQTLTTKEVEINHSKLKEVIKRLLSVEFR